MDWTLIGLILVALVTGYIVGGAIWTERPAPFPTRSYTETFAPSDIDIDIPLTVTRVSRPESILTSDHPLVYLFERKDGSQLLVHVYADGEADLAERPDNSAVWGPPLEGITR